MNLKGTVNKKKKSSNLQNLYTVRHHWKDRPTGLSPRLVVAEGRSTQRLPIKGQLEGAGGDGIVLYADCAPWRLHKPLCTPKLIELPAKREKSASLCGWRVCVLENKAWEENEEAVKVCKGLSDEFQMQQEARDF
jgi:hypothetical protein